MSSAVDIRTKRDTGEFLRYLFCSGASLILDIASFSMSIRLLHLSWVYAACLGFIIGSVSSYLMSIFWVFGTRNMALSQIKEFLTFVFIGVCGLVICEIMLWFGITIMKCSPEITRGVASLVTFLFNFFIRKIALFQS